MKVLGTGSPLMLTIRVRACEVAVLGEELRARRERAITRGLRPLAEGESVACEPRERDVELLEIAELLEQLHADIEPGKPREVVGPTALLDPVVRNAASEAVERLSEAVDVFRAGRGELTAESLRAALDAACAGVCTLIGLEHAQNYAVR